MYIKLYIKKNTGQQLLILILCCVFSVISISCWALFSQGDSSKLSTEENTVKLPVLMYHLVLKNSGDKNKFIVSEKTLEEDLKYINDNGYTTILVKDLIDYTEGKKDLPPKPILLTFDDGAYNNYLYAFPLAKKYNAKFVFSPICFESEKYSKITDENPSYAHANWKHISEMASSGIVEIQNHTYNMHSNKKPRIGCTKRNDESISQYKDRLTEDLKKAQELIKENTGTEPTALFYPFGARSECSEEIVKSIGFKATFLCESKINNITKDSECLFGLNRFIRPPGISSKKFFSSFEK